MNNLKYIILGLIILTICYVLFIPRRVEIAPTPSPSETPYKKYIDMLTQKCYNQEEVEVSCKG